MFDRILRKLNFILLEFSVESLNRLKAVNPFDKLTLQFVKANQEILRPYYEEYVSKVSRSDMAASLELAAFLFSVCKINQYTKLMDVGSGFSSFVFRFYAKQTPGVRVYSIDDDAEWLEKTKHYLNEHSLNTDDMLTVEDFMQLNEGGFDCILHDMNFVEVRIQYVDFVFRSAKKNGLIIMDDVHKMDYRFALLKKLKSLEASCFTLRDMTKDNFGRFAYAVLKK
jgi:2-polyprenyl-3-methyl-5-hydroxy-6-metoxy-1,4-benzoquinol methylase